MQIVKLLVIFLLVLADLDTQEIRSVTAQLYLKSVRIIISFYVFHSFLFISQLFHWKCQDFNLILILFTLEKLPVNPCNPSPCGPNSQCKQVNNQAVCSCLPNYSGSPPGCRPECVVSSECPINKACVAQKCQDPCPGTCGVNSECNVINHSPICICKQGFTGDPFTRCYAIPSKYLKTLSGFV